MALSPFYLGFGINPFLKEKRLFSTPLKIYTRYLTLPGENRTLGKEQVAKLK